MVKLRNINRVVINDAGEAVSPRRAEEMGIVPTIAFVRNDGWVLGCMEQHRELALNMWYDEWVSINVEIDHG